MTSLLRLSTLLGVGLLLAACGGTGKQDTLRDPVSQTGISVGLQVNLPRNASSADAAATIFKNAQRQPLVGGDFFMARSTVDDAVLKSVENLSGDYLGRELLSEEAKVRIGGSGSARLHASVKLDASIAGSGSVIYSGNPEVKQHTLGSGTVRREE